MLGLTKQEQQLIAFLAAALILGTAVRYWRARHDNPAAAATAAQSDRTDR